MNSISRQLIQNEKLCTLHVWVWLNLFTSTFIAVPSTCSIRIWKKKKQKWEWKPKLFLDPCIMHSFSYFCFRYRSILFTIYVLFLFSFLVGNFGSDFRIYDIFNGLYQHFLLKNQFKYNNKDFRWFFFPSISRSERGLTKCIDIE